MEEHRNISKISVRINCAVAEVMKDVERIQGISGLLLRKHWQLSGTSVFIQNTKQLSPTRMQ
jgi:hypothetical protein